MRWVLVKVFTVPFSIFSQKQLLTDPRSLWRNDLRSSGNSSASIKEPKVSDAYLNKKLSKYIPQDPFLVKPPSPTAFPHAIYILVNSDNVS